MTAIVVTDDSATHQRAWRNNKKIIKLQWSDTNFFWQMNAWIWNQQEILVQKSQQKNEIVVSKLNLTWRLSSLTSVVLSSLCFWELQTWIKLPSNELLMRARYPCEFTSWECLTRRVGITLKIAHTKIPHLNVSRSHHRRQSHFSDRAEEKKLVNISRSRQLSREGTNERTIITHRTTHTVCIRQRIPWSLSLASSQWDIQKVVSSLRQYIILCVFCCCQQCVTLVPCCYWWITEDESVWLSHSFSRCLSLARPLFCY